MTEKQPNGATWDDESSGEQLAFASVGEPLGNITKSIFKPENSTGYAQRKLGPTEVAERRKLRYRMQRQAAATLGRNHRVTVCQRVASYGVSQGGGTMGISINESGQAGFHGVGSCGDVWCCPICAQRIAEGRRQEVLAAMRQHREAGGIAVLATFTFAHGQADLLAHQVRALAKALSKLKSSRRYKELLSGVQYRGQIRALEVMHGHVNGWHPHIHEIWFLDCGDIAARRLLELESSIFLLWREVCIRAGLGEPNRENGFKLEYRKPVGMQSAVGAYVAKWGHELTHLQGKTGKLGSRSPWAILQQLTEKFRQSDSVLFSEYAKAIKGRAQLFWSRGLKKHFKIIELTDEHVASLSEKIPVMDIDRATWSAILYFDAHCWVLDVAEQKPLFLRDLLGRLVDLHERRCNTEFIKRWELRKLVKEMTVQAMVDLKMIDIPGYWIGGKNGKGILCSG